MITPVKEKTKILVRKALMRDAPAIHRLIKAYADQGVLLPVSLAEVYERLRDFYVCEMDGEIVGCGALRVVWEDLAEVRSLAVREDRLRRGVGRGIAAECIKDARALGIPRVFALTYQPEFFAKLGFRPISKDRLPHKIWLDCVMCPKFPNCDEQALVLEAK